jgi:outer membrane protein OmpA-like peptidoglycan-associated protein
VRIHNDEAAAGSARAFDAAAYTVGRDIVFGRGQYAPDTTAGKRMLAHELAHVVQQSQGAARQIQRRLVAFGRRPDVYALLGLIRPPSGLNLFLDTTVDQVQIAGSLPGTPSSPSLRSQLTTIINHPVQDAEIVVQPGVSGVGPFGGFPVPADLTFRTVQWIYIDDILALEAGAPGNGVAKAAHEIQESFVAHGAVPKAGTSQYPAAHRAAVEAESDVTTELVGPGRHIAESRQTLLETASGSIDWRCFDEKCRRYAEDFEDYYLVYESSSIASVKHVRRVPPFLVTSLRIDGFGPGSAVLPFIASITIRKAAAAVAANPLSTVLIEGYSDPPAGGASMLGLAEAVLASLDQDRADAVRHAMHAAGVDLARMHSIGRGPVSFVADPDPYISSFSRMVMITVRRPEEISDLLGRAPLVAGGARSMGEPQSAGGDKHEIG